MNWFLKSLTLFIAISTLSFSQLREVASSYAVPPSPTIGWDSLRSLIEYPELLRRAAFEGAATIHVEVDSTGKVDTVIINANSPLFEQSVRHALSQTTWKPGTYGHRAQRGMVSQCVHFYIKGLERTRISVEADRADMKLRYKESGAR